MPARRLLMRKIREVLQLRHGHGLSHQAVARACGVGVGTVNRYLRRAAECGLGWPLPADLDDAVLEARLFPRAAPVRDRVRPLCGTPHSRPTSPRRWPRRWRRRFCGSTPGRG